VSRVIDLSRHRLRHRPGSPSRSQPNDRDLFPVAVALWLASVVRVVLGISEGEVFRTEATLALACVLLIPWARFVSWTRKDRETTDQDRGPGARVIPLPPLQRGASEAQLASGAANRPASRS
jgi:hypothetical protein